jgi:hypothetical protein
VQIDSGLQSGAPIYAPEAAQLRHGRKFENASCTAGRYSVELVKGQNGPSKAIMGLAEFRFRERWRAYNWQGLSSILYEQCVNLAPRSLQPPGDSANTVDTRTISACLTISGLEHAWTLRSQRLKLDHVEALWARRKYVRTTLADNPTCIAASPRFSGLVLLMLR